MPVGRNGRRGDRDESAARSLCEDKRMMRAHAVYLLVLIGLLTAVGCTSSNPVPTNTTQPGPTPAATAAPTPTPLGMPTSVAVPVLAGGACPASHPVKLSADDGSYFAPGMKGYANVQTRQCFPTEAAAQANGYLPGRQPSIIESTRFQYALFFAAEIFGVIVLATIIWIIVLAIRAGTFRPSR